MPDSNNIWNRTAKELFQDKEDMRIYPSMNPQLRDMAALKGNFITRSQYIMLLELEEAQAIVDELLGGINDFFTYYAGPGNIKDGVEGFSNIAKLSTWHNAAGQLVINFRALSIRAVEYTVNGKTYIKITGYAGIRRILHGTRYGVMHPQMLELGIGKRGFAHTIVNGIKICVLFSMAFRAVQFIFQSDYYLADFLVDVSMDIVKIIVSSLIISISGSLLILSGMPVIITTFSIIVGGIYINRKLNILDDEMHLSENLKKALRVHLNNQFDIHSWNHNYLSSLQNALMNRKL